MASKAPAKNVKNQNSVSDNSVSDNSPATENVDNVADNAATETDTAATQESLKARIAKIATEGNPAASQLLNVVFEFKREMEENQNKLNASSGSRSELRDAINSSEDPEIVSIRVELEKIQQKVKEFYTQAASKLNISTGDVITEDQKAAIKQTISDSRKKMREAAKAFEGLCEFVPGTKVYEPILREMVKERAERGTGSAVTTNPDSEATKIREWAKKNNIKVSERGRIAQDVKDRYHAANPGDADENENE